MLGSVADAEDAVQETYLRWHAAERDNVSDPRAFLTTTTTRICLDMLTSARARHEEYVGPWLPEPVVDTAALAPDSRAGLAEDLSIALLLTLDRLSPLERAAFLLHDVFDFSFSEVATALQRSEAACRQLAARARARVRAARPRGATAPPARSGEIDEKHAQLMSAFLAAIRSGDLNALTQLLASDVRVMTDGGGKVAAALDVLDGADRAARFLVDVASKGWREDFTLALSPLMGCRVSWWATPTDRCRLRRSRLRARSFGRCTWCAIRTSYGISRQRHCRTRAVADEQPGLDSRCAVAAQESSVTVNEMSGGPEIDATRRLRCTLKQPERSST
jgi:RNA polymerase sigma-70 factor (ECF subfamily)